MIESNKKGMFMSGVIKSNLMKDTDETDAV